MRSALPLFLSVVSLAGANPPQKPGSVEGVVTNSVSGAPIKKALVTLRSAYSNSGYQALSDPAGRFRFDSVTPGDYGLWAGAQGYVRNSGRLFAPSQAVSVAEEKTIKDFAIRREPLGTIRAGCWMRTATRCRARRPMDCSTPTREKARNWYIGRSLPPMTAASTGFSILNLDVGM